MSVSEGMKKFGSKNYYVRLINLTTEEEIEDNKKGVKIQPWTIVRELKNKIGKYYGVSIKNIRLFYCNIEMMDELTMLDYKIIDAKKPEIFFHFNSAEDNAINIQVYAAFICPPILKKLIEEIRHGFMEGLIPTLILEGTSGTYNLRNTNKEVVALFKPIDEEAFAPNNQKGYTGKFGQESFRKGILSGEGSIREVAAFLLDKNNYFGVPESTFVEIAHPTFNKNANELLSIEDNSLPKMRNSIIHNFILENLISTGLLLSDKLTQKTESVDNSITSTISLSSMPISKYSHIKKKYGSIQRFVKSNDVAANFSSSLFDVKDIHKIGILDIRILNCDRNDENILVCKKRDKTTGKSYYRLIPIDHSLSFPDCIKIQEYEMCWMGWDQAQVPFSKELLSYIKKIDIMGDMQRMSNSIKLRDKCWKNFRVSNIVLKLGAEYGLTLYDIGMILYKPGFDEETPAEVEKLIEKTEKICSLYKLSNVLLSSNKDDDADEGKEFEWHTDIPLEDKNQIILSAVQEQPEDAPLTSFKKKKSSLLKRTASEPKLPTIESLEEDNLNSNSQYNTINSAIEIEDSTNKIKQVTLFNKNLKKTYKEKMPLQTKNTFVDDEDDLDSPFNEVFFYNFENVLIDYLKLHLKVKNH